MPAPPLTTKHNVFLLSHFFLVFLYMVLQRLPIITLFLTNVTSVNEGVRKVFAFNMISDVVFARMFEVRTDQTTRHSILTPSNVLV